MSQPAKPADRQKAPQRPEERPGAQRDSAQAPVAAHGAR